MESIMSNPNHFETIIKLELDKINETMPAQRVTLASLMKMEKPYILTKKNEKIFVFHDELTAFAKFFDEDMWNKIRVPIVFLNVKDIFKVSGAKMEQWVVEKLMGYIKNSFVVISHYQPTHEYYYSYQVRKIKKQFPNLVQIMYSL